MRIDIAAQTDIGRRKKKNEDYYGVFREDTPGLRLFKSGALLAVADGLGGHTGGEIASKLAVSHVKDVLKQGWPAGSSTNGEVEEGPIPLVKQFVTSANETIYRTNQDLIKSGRPMGTTLLTAIVTPRKAYIVNVGDSRAYQLRDGEIISRTEDHSWVDEQVKQGLMSRAEAEVDERRHMVTRSIGTHPEVVMDAYVWHVVPGDMLLLCTDGLINMVKDQDIREVFTSLPGPAEIAHRLVDMANDNGGRDNITVIVADIMPSLSTLMRRRIVSFSKKRGAGIVYLSLTLAFGALCFVLGHYFGDSILGLIQ
jgi:PPM family protein phosphatase